jgi:beta-lactam-binding protein with PASTA domain
MTVAQATTALTAAGFVVAEEDVVIHNPTKIGKVIAQAPAVGTNAKQGTTVTITVGRTH